MATNDKDITLGAITDMTTSGALLALRAPANQALVPVHAVIGNVSPTGILNPALSGTCPYPAFVCAGLLAISTLANVVASASQLTNTDTVVSTVSQGGGLPATAQSSALPVPHFTTPNLSGETSSISVTNEFIRLLNEQTTAPDYAPHF